MKIKIENTNFWVGYKLEKTLGKTLSYYKKQELFNFLTPIQVEKIEKILELEEVFEKEHRSHGYLLIPRLLEKEPSSGTPKLDNVINFFIEYLYPAITLLQKEITQDKRDIEIKGIQNNNSSLQNVFWNINHCLNRFKKGKRFLDDAYKKKIKLEVSGGNFDVETYVKGMKGYICGNGQTFVAGDGTLGHMGNAKIYESLELAQKKQPGYGVFEVEIKLVTPSLTKKTSMDENIKKLIVKDNIEKSLPQKSELSSKPPKI